MISQKFQIYKNNKGVKNSTTKKQNLEIKECGFCHKHKLFFID